MKYIGVFISSILGLVLISGNFYYNSVALDMKKIKDYVEETNIILEDISYNKSYVLDNKEEYIKRLNNIRDGLSNTNTTFLINDYKIYKSKSIDSLVVSLENGNDENLQLEDVTKYNKLCDEELDKLIISKSISNLYT